jgi:DNA polymerase III alpha subunit (gram-positive type)
MGTEIVVYDTEYWAAQGALERCWHGIDDQLPVLIQIGAYKVRLEEGLPLISELVSFITPIGRTGEAITLNKYFSDLTGITQEKIDREGKHPREAIAEFHEFTGNRTMYSYGDDVVDTFLPTCFAIDIKCPFNLHQAKDARHILRKSGVTEAEISTNRSGSIAHHFGVESRKLHEHDAKDDAFSLLEAMRHLVKIGRLKLEWL